MKQPPSDAPGSLEQVRTLLNTWRVPHHDRVPVDDLPALAVSARRWRAALPGVPRPDTDGIAELMRFRDDLRANLGIAAPTRLASWLARYPVMAAIDERELVRYVAAGDAPGQLLAVVVRAIASDRWGRLKACPDCRHVFYDHSRNRSRTWCGMYAGAPEGRACGSIAKVHAYRQRHRQSTT